MQGTAFFLVFDEKTGGIFVTEIPPFLFDFYSISFFLKSQGVIQEIYYGEHKYLLCHIEQYEELFTDIFCGEYELSSDPMEHLYKIPLCEKGQDLQKFLYDMEL